MLSSLSPEQRQAIESMGTPLAISDHATGVAYLLLSVRMSELSDGSIAASIPGLGLFSEGGDPEEAVASLAEAARLLCEI